MSLTDRIVENVLEKVEKGESLFLEERPPLDYVTTTSLEIDSLLGKPGIPLGRITQLKGWSQSGKSMLACNIIASCQNMGGEAVLFDTEGSYTSEWAKQMGVDTSRLIDFIPTLSKRGKVSLEAVLRGIHAVVDAVNEDEETPVIIVVDSLAIPHEAELVADYDDLQPGVHAKLLSKGMRKLTMDLQNKRVGLICISQLREKLMQFGSPTTTIGGHAIGFHAAITAEMKRISYIMENNKKIGFTTRIIVDKSKLGGIPYEQREVNFYFDRGIDPYQSMLSVALEYGIVNKSGGWYNFSGKKFRESGWKEILTPELENQIKKAVFPDFYV